MRKVLLVLFLSVLMVPSGISAATQDVTAPIHQFIDGFNTGDTKSPFAAYATGGRAQILRAWIIRASN